jgi:hypothetical protein
VLNSTEGAHIKDMSAFEADEHLREPMPPPSAEVESAGGQPKMKLTRMSGLEQLADLARAPPYFRY